MPRWLTHARNLTAFRRRWQFQQPIGEVLSGVLPVAVIDKHYDPDDHNRYGMLV